MNRVLSVAVASLFLAISLPVRAGDTTVLVERFPFAFTVPRFDCGSFLIWMDVHGQTTYKTVWSKATGELLSDLTVAQFSSDFYTDPEHPELGLHSLPGENNAYRIDWTTGIGENHGTIFKVFIPGYGLAHVAGHITVDLNTGTVLTSWDVGSGREVGAALCAYFAQ